VNRFRSRLVFPIVLDPTKGRLPLAACRLPLGMVWAWVGLPELK
jgi:hypothetical protein